MKRIIITISAALLLCAGASAQSFRSGYFLDRNYTYGYRINPAQINRKSFMALGLGNIDLQNSCNIGISNLLFPTETGLVTGFNKAVSADEFIGKFPEFARLNLDENINILSSGTVKPKSMRTFEINLRTMAGFALPRDLFAFLKQGGDRVYDLSGLSLNADVIADAALGFSRRLGKNMSIGARFHFLVDVASVSAYTAKTNIVSNTTEATLNTELHLQTAGMPALSTDEKGNIGGIALGGPTIAGYGGGADFGIELRPFKGLSLMASITDFGIIKRKTTSNLVASSSVSYTGTEVSYEDGEVKYDMDVDALLAKLKEAIVFTEAGAEESLVMLPYNLQVGGQLNLLGLKLGALATYHKDSINPWYDMRAGATISMGYFLSASVNAGIGTYGPSLGAAAALNVGPINLIAGVDAIRGDVGQISDLPLPASIPAIPLPLNGFMLNAHVGLTMNVGRLVKEEVVKKDVAPKKTKSQLKAEEKEREKKVKQAEQARQALEVKKAKQALEEEKARKALEVKQAIEESKARQAEEAAVKPAAEAPAEPAAEPAVEPAVEQAVEPAAEPAAASGSEASPESSPASETKVE